MRIVLIFEWLEIEMSKEYKATISSLKRCKPILKNRLKIFGMLPGVRVTLEKVTLPFSDYFYLSSANAQLLIGMEDLSSILLKEE
jgi:Fe2+ transport system protein FeoA